MIRFVFCPTPIDRFEALDAMLGVRLWVKRDDMTGGAEAGNKVRKLERLLAHALEEKATHVITCGGIQSNHARATALMCARLGLACTLLLRQREGQVPGPSVDAPRNLLPKTGNVLLDRLAGAKIRLITPAHYADRETHMQSVADELARADAKPYVIPEGGSNGRGALGYVDCMKEIKEQLGNEKPFEHVVSACGSGGTAAGVALGCALYGVATRARTFAVCDDASYFAKTIARIVHEARAIEPTLPTTVPLAIDDTAKGPAYGVMDDAQKRFLVRAARAGLIVDPVYTGKALFGLAQAVVRGEIPRGARVLFLHTGGLPGLLAEGSALEDHL